MFGRMAFQRLMVFLLGVPSANTSTSNEDPVCYLILIVTIISKLTVGYTIVSRIKDCGAS